MIKLVCFDLDDTLIKEPNSVMFLCLLNGKLRQFLEIDKLEKEGLHWIEGDYRKALLAEGLPQQRPQAQFDTFIKPIGFISETVGALRKLGIRSIIITAGPRQVGHIAKERWGFDASYGSDYEVKGGVFTGKIIRHIGDEGKIDCLVDYCRRNGLGGGDCAAVGDGSTDIPLFEYCGRSIALNAAPQVEKMATCALRTDDLRDILPFIL